MPRPLTVLTELTLFLQWQFEYFLSHTASTSFVSFNTLWCVASPPLKHFLIISRLCAYAVATVLNASIYGITFLTNQVESVMFTTLYLVAGTWRVTIGTQAAAAPRSIAPVQGILVKMRPVGSIAANTQASFRNCGITFSKLAWPLRCETQESAIRCRRVHGRIVERAALRCAHAAMT